MKDIKIEHKYFTCTNCDYKYSAHLSSKCPKCNHTGIVKHIDMFVEIPKTIDFFIIKIGEKK